MFSTLTNRERGVRGVLAALLAIVVYRLGFPGDTLGMVQAIGATILCIAAAGTAISGRSLTALGLAGDLSLAMITARLFIGWEFAHAGWEKLTGDGWVGSSAGTGIGGFLHNTVSAPMTSGPHPAVPGWFAAVTNHVFLHHTEVMSYAITFGELAVGIGLIVGLFTRTAAFFGVTLSLAFLLAGSTGGGLNPEMLAVGLLLFTGATAAVHALSLDRVVPKLTLTGDGTAGRHLRLARVPVHVN